MSPLLVRRFRAERLLRDEFEKLRSKVVAGAAERLRRSGARLDADDLDACYSQAWQGLYAAVLDGQQIDEPAAWLTLVTYRRAVDELRSRSSLASASLDALAAADDAQAGSVATVGARVASGEREIAAELDDRARLRHLFEALRTRLSTREQQAATLCYLQGLSRAEAAARMGVSEARMRKLMEGRGAGSPGVAAKMGALVETIGAGTWCEEQGSLMRGFAYGILDPAGERHRLATLHRDACPACRAYVLSLRGLAAALPPVPMLLHWTLAVSSAGGAAATSGTSAGAGAGAGGGAAGVGGAGPLGGAAGGALSASGAAGIGAAGGGWWLAGPLGAKLAVGCLLALGVGAGCVALEGRSTGAVAPAHRRHVRRDAPAPLARVAGDAPGAQPLGGAGAPTTIAPASAPAARSQPSVAAAKQASREFGPEQAAAREAGGSAGSQPRAASAARAVAAARSATVAQRPSGGGARDARSTGGGSSSGAIPAAQREFAPG